MATMISDTTAGTESPFNNSNEVSIASTSVANYFTTHLPKDDDATQNASHGLNSSSDLCYTSISSKEGDVDKMNTYIFQNIFAPSLILTIFLFILGFLGNAVVFHIYFRRWRRTTLRIFILALAGFDLINCSLLPIEMVLITNIIKFDYPIVCKFSRWLTFTMNNCSSLTLVVMAIDRYIRICLPMKMAMSNKQAKIWIVIAIVMSLATTWPSLVFYGTSTYIIPTLFPGECVVGKLCLFEDKYTNSPYRFYFTIFLLVGTLVIDVVLIACYSRIIYTVIKRGIILKQSQANKTGSFSTENDALNIEVGKSSKIVTKQTSFKKKTNKKTSTEDNFGNIDMTSSQNEHDFINNRENREKRDPIKEKRSRSVFKNLFHSKRKSESWSVRSDNGETFRMNSYLPSECIEKRKAQMYRTTIILCSVTIVFVMSFVPYCVIVIIRYLDPPYYRELTLNGKAVYQFLLRSYLLSSSLNPVIYSFLSEQFRTECKTLFCNILVKCRVMK